MRMRAARATCARCLAVSSCKVFSVWDVHRGKRRAELIRYLHRPLSSLLVAQPIPLI